MGLHKRDLLSPPLRLRHQAVYRPGQTWQVFSPVVYRYLEQRYVEAFFADGSLRLTSFSRCQQHADEQRLDHEEGLIRVLVSSRKTGDFRSLTEFKAGTDPFILCTTLWHNQSLMQAFGCDSFIRIHDPAEFGARVSKHIPGFVQGGEGPCMYQNRRLIEAAIDDTSTSSDIFNEGSRNDLEGALKDAVQHFPFFIKHRSFSHQAEYRLLWVTSVQQPGDYLDIKVPEARELCSLPGTFEFEEEDLKPAESR